MEANRMLESDYLKGNLSFLEKLRAIPTLSTFSEEELKGLLELSRIRKYEPGELILEEGFFDSWIYFLVSGKVKIVKHEEDISILQRKGDIFGEMSIINGSPRSASVYAVDKTVCLATDAAYIDRLSDNDRIAFCYILYRIFSEILADRLRLTTEELIKEKEENKKLKSAGKKV
jgi:CRP-like cAMP-binding protein